MFVVPSTFGGDPRLDRAPLFIREREIYVGRDPAGPYCAVVAPGRAVSPDSLIRFVIGLSARELSDARTTPGVLGPCALWARYGQPGTAVARWLADGGHRFAERRFGALPPGEGSLQPRRLFGVRGGAALFGFSAPGQACLSGQRDACVTAVTRHRLDPFWFQAAAASSSDRRRGTATVFDGSRRYEAAFGRAELALLADLERAIGPERFGRFWRGGGSLETAFASAVGAPLGDWIFGWASRRNAVQPRGPRLDLLTVALSLVLVTALVGIGLAVSRRRQI